MSLRLLKRERVITHRGQLWCWKTDLSIIDDISELIPHLRLLLQYLFPVSQLQVFDRLQRLL